MTAVVPSGQPTGPAVVQSCVASAEDWQAQLEELLALQAIYGEDFRWALGLAG